MIRVFNPISGKSIIYYFVLIFALMSVCKANAQITPATPGIQAIMFSKILSYVRTIDEGEGYTVLVAYDANSGQPSDIIEAFKEEGLNVIISKVSEIESEIDKTQILYLPSRLSNESIKKLNSYKNKLFITGDPDYTLNGIASLSVGLEDERIKILVNLSVLEGNNHQVSSELINLARVIK